MSQADSTLKFLFSLQKSGIKAGLGNIRYLLASLGRPENSFPTVHVAGTNGKGSTSAMIAAILTASGYRTGLYTSPHLVDFTERIRINGRKIPVGRLASYTRGLAAEIRRTGATFFESATAIAFQYFADERVDIAVIETGLGGRWDSTNVVTPLVSVITTIGMEHQEYLGGTIRKIAFEKAGVIKRGTPCVVGDLPGPALGVIKKRAAKIDARIVRTARTTTLTRAIHEPGGFIADLRIGRKKYSSLRVAAPGIHQEGNVRMALQVSEILRNGPGSYAITDKSVRHGLVSLQSLTGFSGRLQLVKRSPPIVADVAHNPEGVRALVDSLRRMYAGKFRVVFGVMEDKDYRTMIDLLEPICRMFYFVRPAGARSRDPKQLLAYAHEMRLSARLAGSADEGLRAASGENRAREPVLVTGSHFIVGEAMRILGVGV